jgi:hypothetical protein
MVVTGSMALPATIPRFSPIFAWVRECVYVCMIAVYFMIYDGM